MSAQFQREIPVIFCIRCGSGRIVNYTENYGFEKECRCPRGFVAKWKWKYKGKIWDECRVNFEGDFILTGGVTPLSKDPEVV